MRSNTWKIPWVVFIKIDLSDCIKFYSFTTDFPLKVIANKLFISGVKSESRWKLKLHHKFSSITKYEAFYSRCAFNTGEIENLKKKKTKLLLKVKIIKSNSDE